MALSITNSGNAKVKIPKVWFFPKTRMRSAIRKAGYAMEDIRSNTYKSNTVLIFRKGENVGTYYTGDGYYPDFRTSDETLKQLVAPYVNFVENSARPHLVPKPRTSGGEGGGGGGGGA